MESKIDFIITWVDGSDSTWIEKKKSYLPKNDSGLNKDSRYRDWGFLKYWFRAVEKNTPWVNKVFFVTEGHIPDWLNVDYEKLIIIRHDDYIDSKHLPTFNSNVIELNFHKIKGLSDFFVNFNDDMFINKELLPEDFFEDELPKDIGVFSPIVPKRGSISSIVQNNVEVINDYFSFRRVLGKYFFKFFNLKYGKHLIKNLCVLPWSNILGFYDNHIPVAYKKEFFKILWDNEGELLEKVSGHRFRQKDDVNHWLIRYWQLCTGSFIPRNIKFGNYYDISSELMEILSEIESPQYSIICLNDGDGVVNFEDDKLRLLDSFERRYPNKSRFER
ncbi:Stealth protein CR1, conserved region 1 [Streptococcus henryi]|uniref:Stealth protein CR1, conserved region 1 n=1 Tax=Streptococcus henryi TaxID=439219 RepID=A0A1G6DA06_9STRE|nr:stealth family protein [Streptococcus henryi]SDB41941.1 Stealth protein CR1, conserved region 1 [Streptococcus henryi]